MSSGSSLTSVNGLLTEAYPSVDSRMTGDDASEEVELGSLECPHSENVGEGKSEVVEEAEGCCACPVDIGDSVLISLS